MNMPEFGGHLKRPELDRANPALLFMYAKDMQAWWKMRLSPAQFPEAIDRLANELNGYMREEEVAPEVKVVTKSATSTTNVIEAFPGKYVIETGAPDFEGDDEVYEEYNLQGDVVSFYRGEQDELRAYISSSLPEVRLPGGIFTPLVSVGVADSEFRLTAYPAQEQIEERLNDVIKQLTEYGQEVSDAVSILLGVLNSTNESSVGRLQDSSRVVREILRISKVEQSFIDALLDVISMKLRLDVPQDMHAAKHRTILTKRPTPSYLQGGEARFQGIVPQLEMIGETADRSIGVIFLQDDRVVQIPVQYLLSIYRTNA